MSAETAVRARILVSGLVQGVAYRAFVQRAASQRGLSGGVRNLDDGRVEVEVEGQRHVIEEFIGVLKVGPPMARVRDVSVQWDAATGRHPDFSVWY